MYRVLIVDDERPVHLAIQALLDWHALHAHEPCSAYNGQEGLSMMDTLRPDIVFVDMHMPLMDGMAFLAAATHAHPNAQYIVVSGYDAFEFAQAAIRFNVVDYLLKPIDRDELAGAFQKAVERLPDRELDPDERTPAAVIAAVKDYIDRNYGQDISINHLAEKFYFSREYLNRLFRAQYGSSLYEYVQQVRMQKAAELLTDPAAQLQDIAEKLGFSNANYFSKAFKKWYGMTPSEYREQEGRKS